MPLSRRLCLFVLTVLIVSFLFDFRPIPKAMAEAGLTVHNVSSGRSYATIQEAVDDNATLDGHVIQVDANVYYEHVLLYKAVILLGENSSSTIVDGQGSGTVIDVVAANVTVAGFTVRNSGLASGRSGVDVRSSDSCNISGNVISGNWFGIWLESSNGSTVSNNSFTDNWNAIYVDSSAQCLVSGNSVSANDFALWIDMAEGVDSQSNTITDNGYAVWIAQSANVSLSGNRIENSSDGVLIYNDSRNIKLLQNSISSNDDYAVFMINCSEASVVGNNVMSKAKEAIYVQDLIDSNLTDNVISSGGHDGISLHESDGNVIDGNLVTGGRDAIAVYGSVGNAVSGNELSGNDRGIVLSGSDGGMVVGNKVVGNGFGIDVSNSRNVEVGANNVTGNANGGISIAFSSNNELLDNFVVNSAEGVVLRNSSDNLVVGNLVSKSGDGLRLEESGGNSVFNNTLIGNTDGIRLLSSDNNTLWVNIVSSGLGAGINVSDSHLNVLVHNSFFNNALGPVSVNSSNVWDDGVEGNFWGYGTGVDADGNGIADNPFVIGDGNEDNFPLMGQYTQFALVVGGHQYVVGIVSNGSLSDFAYFRDPSNLTSIMSFNVGRSEGLGFCRIDVAHDLISPPFEVLVDNAQPYSQTAVASNATFSWVYFTFPYLGGSVRVGNLAPPTPFWAETWFWGIVALAFVVGVLVLAVFLFYRRLSSYRRTIDDFERRLRETESSPLEVARRLFDADVEQRGVKIGRFEDKYGIRIRPRDSLNDILRGLELKERKKKNEVSS